MNKKKLYISLAVLVILLLAAIIVYLCFFGRKTVDPDDKREKYDTTANVKYTDAFGNIIDETTIIHNEVSQEELDEMSRKSEAAEAAAVEAIAGDLVIPDTFIVEDAMGDIISEDEFGTQITYRLKVGDDTLKYTIDRAGTVQPMTAEELPAGMTLEKKQIDGVDVDIVSDGQGYICTWNDAAGSHKLIAPIEKSDANAAKLSEWIGLLIMKAE